MDSTNGEVLLEDNSNTSPYGPAIVAVANAARAFDAPVRRPVLSAVPGVNFAGADPLADVWFPYAKGSSFVALVEHLIGVVILVPILFVTRGLRTFRSAFRNFDRRDWFSVIFISAGSSALGLFFFLISLAAGKATVAILLQKVQPLITIIFAYFILKERLTKEFWAALLVAGLGVLLLTAPDIFDSSFEINAVVILGAASSLIAAIFWGGGTVFGRILTSKVDYWDLTLMRYTGGFFFLFLFNIVLLNYTSGNFDLLGQSFNVFKSQIPEFPFSGVLIVGILAIAYSAVLTGGIIPLGLYYLGLRMSKASVAGLAELTFPVLAIFVNFVFIPFETLDFVQIIGAMILLADISLLVYLNAQRARN